MTLPVPARIAGVARITRAPAPHCDHAPELTCRMEPDGVTCRLIQEVPYG